MYKVLACFTDDKDGNHINRVGDAYPRPGYTPDDERINYLLSDKNSFKRPIIAKVATKPVVDIKPVEVKKGKE